MARRLRPRTLGSTMKKALCYCGNVHPAKDLDELLGTLASGPALVRASLGRERLSYGLWLSDTALQRSASEQHRRLRAALDEHGLDVWTMNAFPLGDFHAPVVKHAVYHPHWGQPERLHYTLRAAELLAQLLPESRPYGSISTLPIGYGRDFADAGQLRLALNNLRAAALGLAEIESKSGKHIRLCLEPEPACVLETGRDAVRLFEQLRAEHRGEVERYLGLCLDTCHHAVAFEDANALLDELGAADICIGKVQLSSAVDLDPRSASARSALRALDEPRFLHQVRAQLSSGQVIGCDDLPESSALEAAERWRVHYHLPIHRERYGELHTTRDFLVAILRRLRAESPSTHFEVETYTWGVLPSADRPSSPEALASCIAEELRFAEGELA